jgi:hypothetical protein
MDIETGEAIYRNLYKNVNIYGKINMSGDRVWLQPYVCEQFP